MGTVPSATHGVGSAPPWLQASAVPGVVAAGEPALGAELQPCEGSGTGWAPRAAPGNLAHAEQARTAWPPPRTLAAWHVSLLPTACQENSLAAWKRARLSRQRIFSSRPWKAVSRSGQINRGASLRRRSAQCRGWGVLLRPGAGAAWAWPKQPAPISPAPPQVEREGLSPGILAELVKLGQDLTP